MLFLLASALGAEAEPEYKSLRLSPLGCGWQRCLERLQGGSGAGVGTTMKALTKRLDALIECCLFKNLTHIITNSSGCILALDVPNKVTFPSRGSRSRAVSLQSDAPEVPRCCMLLKRGQSRSSSVLGIPGFHADVGKAAQPQLAEELGERRTGVSEITAASREQDGAVAAPKGTSPKSAHKQFLHACGEGSVTMQREGMAQPSLQHIRAAVPGGTVRWSQHLQEGKNTEGQSVQPAPPPAFPQSSCLAN